MTPVFEAAGVTVLHGDCIEVMAELAPDSVDAVVTDPPYSVEFMGLEWDRPWAVTPAAGVGFEGREDNLTLPQHSDSRNANCRACGGRQRGATRCACEQPDWDRAPAEDMRAFGAWCTVWATECYRVLKPGGHLLAFGGARTWHRLTCGIEDAGFEVRDSIAWLYGQGFPKSLNVGAAIDKALGADRPVVATGEPVKRMIPGADQNRTGSWIKDNGREYTPTVTAPGSDESAQWEGWGTALKPAHEPIVVARKPLAGTVAGNVLKHGTGALNIDACRTPTSDSLGGGAETGTTSDQKGHDGWKRPWMDDPEASSASAERVRSNVVKAEALGRWPTNVILSDDQADALDAQTGTLTSGASRFFPTFRYEAKADQSERPRVDGEAHPTVKPLDLMRWLVRLVTPPGGVVLDPFLGSGTTAEACVVEGFECIGIERHAPYLPLIEARLSKPLQPVLFGGES